MKKTAQVGSRNEDNPGQARGARLRAGEHKVLVSVHNRPSTGRSRVQEVARRTAIMDPTKLRNYATYSEDLPIAECRPYDARLKERDLFS